MMFLFLRVSFLPVELSALPTPQTSKQGLVLTSVRAEGALTPLKAFTILAMEPFQAVQSR